MLATMFAHHFADYNDSWRATLALIRTSLVGRSIISTSYLLKAIEASRQKSLLNYWRAQDGISVLLDAYFFCDTAHGRPGS